MSIKLLIIPVLCIAALIVGLAIGYVVLGDKPLSDVFDSNTWKHMYDLVFAEGG
ncbi:DNA-directed RNA polymerase subunit beta [Cohnella luojiensis]|uniref:DNA-directed RNA polymerase subunit beta n=2 Tax=Cohnella luojiensis TaxID=652876 RepID=A0A4Y8M461_9BACL|nr:DNA-directed RNA polymerase subunit beta [Cohnella luojiensis]